MIVTCAALKAGCHVIGEKPMASTMAEARHMVHAAIESAAKEERVAVRC